jgi:hypothetical protein
MNDNQTINLRNLPLLNHSPIVALPMKGLRRNDDAIKNRSWKPNKNK